MGYRTAASVWLGAALTLLSCAPRSVSHTDRVGDSRPVCIAAEGTMRPFTMGWSAARSASMESQRLGLVSVVKYDGCELELLEECRLPGKCVFLETARSVDGFSIADGSELESRLPLGSSDLLRELGDDDGLRVRYVTSGVLGARISSASKGMLEGDCDAATHIVQTMVLGAYEITSQGDAHGGSLRSGGDLKTCGDSETPALGPACGAIVQVLLTPTADVTTDRDDLYSDLGLSGRVDQAMVELEDILRLGEDGLKDAQATDESRELSELSHRIRRLPDGGSDGWDVLVQPMILESYDANRSVSIDTVGEVTAIPCEVYITLDRSIHAGRGGLASLRGTYGFQPSYRWVGDQLGFDEIIRADADARLQNCGL